MYIKVLILAIMVNIGGIQCGSCNITTSNDVDTPRNFCGTIDIMDVKEKWDNIKDESSGVKVYRDSSGTRVFITEDPTQKPPEGYYPVEYSGATSHIVYPQALSFDSGVITTVGEVALGEPSPINIDLPIGTGNRMLTVDSHGVIGFKEDVSGTDQTESGLTIDPVGGSGPGATSITIPGVIPGGVLGVGDGMEQPDNGVNLDMETYSRLNIDDKTVITGEGNTKYQEYLIETKDVLYYDEHYNVKIAKNATITYKVTGYEKRQVTKGRTTSTGITTTYAAIFYEDFPIKKLHSIISSHPIDEQYNDTIDIKRVISISEPNQY